MTQQDIIKLAREAGASPYTNRHYPDRPFHTFSPEQLEAFARLVAEKEQAKNQVLLDVVKSAASHHCLEDDECGVCLSCTARSAIAQVEGLK